MKQPEIATFYQNKAGAVSLTFDDGPYDSGVFFDAELEKYGFRGTAMLIPDRLTEKGIVEKWQALLKNGNLDVGNHSKSHQLKYKDQKDSLTAKELETDITDAYHLLSQWFPEQNILTFASPWGQLSDQALAEIKKFHFARRGHGKIKNADPKGDEWYDLKATTYDGHSLDNINAWANQAIQNNDWTIVLFHDCKEGNISNGLTIAKEMFSDHLAYLNQNKDKLWVASLNEATAYIMERQNSSVSVIQATDEEMILKLTDSLPDEKFYHPLTLLIHVPSHWTKGVSYVQGELKGESKIIKTENNRLYVQIDGVPDQGLITVKKK